VVHGNDQMNKTNTKAEEWWWMQILRKKFNSLRTMLPDSKRKF
jgi:hypothetical protein